MMKTSPILIVCALGALAGCKDKKKPAAQPPPVANVPTPTTEVPAQPEVAIPEPPAQLDRSINDGAASRDGDVAALILRPKDGSEVDVKEPGGLLVFVRPNEAPKAAMAGEWTAFRILGPGGRFGVRQSWTFSGGTLSIKRVNKNDKSEAHAVSFKESHYAVANPPTATAPGWTETGVSSGRFFFGLRLVEKPPVPEGQEGDVANQGPSRNVTLGIRRQRCGAEAVEGTWREFRLAKKQLVEWKIGKGSFTFSVWDGQQSGDPKVVRKGSYAFDAASCAAVFKPLIEGEGGGSPPPFETFFDPDSGLAIGAIGPPNEYNQVSLWFRASKDAAKHEQAGAWAVLRYPPRVGFVNVDERGAFEGSIGERWDLPTVSVSGDLMLGDKVGGSWVAKPGAAAASPVE